MPVHVFNLVVPLGHEPTAMRITDTGAHPPHRSGAVSPLRPQMLGGAT